MITIRVQTDDFEVGAEISALAVLGGGAVASFVGQVRGDSGVCGLELEHYPAMTEKALKEIAETANGKWELYGTIIVHRVGKLKSGDQIVLVCTCSNHRRDSLEACSYIMDRLKTDAPFWKKELRADGTGKWVEERQSDVDAARGWENN